MDKWQVIVGNLGTAYSGKDGFRARVEFNSWAKVAREDSTSRAYGEDVTLMRDGEIVSEQKLSVFNVEVTDTFGGDANYCWVNRYKVQARNHREALRRMEPGRVWVFDYDIPDEYATKRFNARSACICAFVSFWDDDVHSHNRFDDRTQ